jgi:hypothetical protein
MLQEGEALEGEGMGQPAREIERTLPRLQRKTMTLLDLVAAVAEVADSEDEVVATVRHLINSGQVRLVGHFRGADVRIA